MESILVGIGSGQRERNDTLCTPLVEALKVVFIIIIQRKQCYPVIVFCRQEIESLLCTQSAKSAGDSDDGLSEEWIAGVGIPLYQVLSALFFGYFKKKHHRSTHLIEERQRYIDGPDVVAFVFQPNRSVVVERAEGFVKGIFKLLYRRLLALPYPPEYRPFVGR